MRTLRCKLHHIHALPSTTTGTLIVTAHLHNLHHARATHRMTFIDNLGYAISNRSFRGPWIDPAQISNGTTKLDRVSLFAVKKTWKAAQDKVDRRLL